MVMSTKRRNQPVRIQQRLHKRIVLSAVILRPRHIPLLLDDVVVETRGGGAREAGVLERTHGVRRNVEEG